MTSDSFFQLLSITLESTSLLGNTHNLSVLLVVRKFCKVLSIPSSILLMETLNMTHLIVDLYGTSICYVFLD